ncbi:MAG: EamA family transporter [Bacteroidetes bacterium]|nr:EamA family transporter [Bacteroidota bacterium]MBK8658141.1 EamA family transporter [Bacteroidota bacterium]
MISKYYSQSDITKAHIQMHLSILLWGFTGVLGKMISLSEGMLVWYRMMLVTASLLLYIKFTKTSIHVSAVQLRKLFVVGTLLMVHWLFFYGAIKYSNVSVTLSLFASTTLFTALLEPLITPKKFNKTELLYSFMALAGIGIIFYSDENAYTVGIVLALLASFIGAFFNIMNKDLVHEVKSSVVSFYEIASGLVSLTVFLPVYIHYLKPPVLYPSFQDWTLLVVLAVVCTHITLILSLNALKHLSAFTLNLAINLEPVYGIALAFLFFGENTQLNKWFFVGSFIIMLSVLLHSYFASKE